MKLTVIGGCGSRSLMLAKCLAQLAESLGISEVVFMDTDQERVRVFGSMVKEVFARTAPSVHYVCTTDEKEAVWEADFIITTIRAGKEESRIIDERVALKHGVIGQETTGVGGFAMALRSIPTLLHYCELIRRYAAPARGHGDQRAFIPDHLRSHLLWGPAPSCHGPVQGDRLLCAAGFQCSRDTDRPYPD